MASVSLEYSGREHFPGKVDESGGVYEFPSLYSIDKKERIHIWTQYIILVKNAEFVYDDIDWEVPDDVSLVKIKDEYFDDETLEMKNIIALIYNETGIVDMKITRNAATEVKNGALGLKGKKNARNTFMQALIKARSFYNKKISAGYSLDNIKTESNLFYAMAANKYNTKHVKFPCYSQPKLDGLRCLITYNNNKIYKYSRRIKNWPGFEDLDILVKPLLDKIPGLTLDGELYAHGIPLQTIAGVARNEKKSIDLDYYIFDLFVVENGEIKKLKFVERVQLMIMLKEINKSERIKFVKTECANNQKELDAYYNNYIKNKFEGQMIRNPKSYYESTKYREMRTNNLLKRKKLFTGEFELVDVDQATNGRAAGTFIGIFRVPNSAVTFKSTPKDYTMDESRKLFLTVSKNIDKYRGQMATLEYQDLSKDGVPLRAKFILFRKDEESSDSDEGIYQGE